MTEKEKLIELLDRNFGYTEEERAEVVADRLLDAGVRPIVMCRDCIHWFNPRKQMCIGRKPDFFCAAGEKR